MPESTTCNPVAETGTLSVTIGGFTASTSYGSSSTAASLASALAASLNGSGSPVRATASPGAAADATEQHFTSKVRDAESGNDYFGARYYASTMGRFLSPDYSLDGTIMELPQTWNKYGYEYNRPLYGTDPDGRCPPCIGAVIGGVVEGGFDLGKQLYNNGGSLSKVSWGEVGANVAGGAAAGALAGATGGASLVGSALIGDFAAGTTSSIVGGIVTRSLDPNTSADDVLSGTAISEDALAGFVGGGAGHVASEFVHIPDDPTFHFNGRGGKAYRQALHDLKAQSLGAHIRLGALTGVLSSSAAHASNGIGTFLGWWGFQPSPPPPPPQPHNHACTIFVTPNGESAGCNW